jgi:hypothetical protein
LIKYVCFFEKLALNFNISLKEYKEFYKNLILLEFEFLSKYEKFEESYKIEQLNKIRESKNKDFLEYMSDRKDFIEFERLFNSYELYKNVKMNEIKLLNLFEHIEKSEHLN